MISDDLLVHIKELVELEYGIDLVNEDRIRLVVDEADLDTLFSVESIKDIQLFVPSFVLLSGEQEELAINRNIKVISIPEYYFAEELREAGEL